MGNMPWLYDLYDVVQSTTVPKHLGNRAKKFHHCNVPCRTGFTQQNRLENQANQLLKDNP
jgi:hypothetical protein